MPPGPELARRRTLHLEVAHRLGARIVNGELAPGITLPNEADLCAELGVSRTVVREAMKVLASKSLVEVRPRTGTRVRPRSEWQALDHDVLTWQFSSDSAAGAVIDLLEMRLIVEPAAARLAASRASRADLERLRLACQQMEQAEGDTEASIQPDVAFHLTVLEAAGNAFLRPLGGLMQTALGASFRLSSGDEPAYRRTLQQHTAVYRAIAAGDAQAAEQAMHELLSRTSGDLLAALRLRQSRKGRQK